MADSGSESDSAAPSEPPMTPRRAAALLALIAAALPCCSGDDAAPDAQPAGWQDGVALSVAEDLDPSDGIVEITLDARVEGLEILPGRLTPAWTYNGTVPGPLIRGRVGDRLLVHFTNHLPEPTTIHWHGLRVPNAMDGVPGVTQAPVQPGESFTYDFVLQDAGTYWYHPHVNSAAQVGWGLYGALIVDDPAQPPFGDELVLLLSDMSLNDEGQFLGVDAGGDFGDLFGREGSALLVNGRVNPVLEVQSGRRQHWRVIDGARSRYFTIGFDGHAFTKIGGDGGLAATPVPVTAPILTPGERAELLVVPTGAPGTQVQLQWLPTERGYGSTFQRQPEDLFRVRFADTPTVAPGPEPQVSRAIAETPWSGAPEISMELTIDQGSMGLTMGINHIPFSEVVPFRATLGETQVWKLINNSDFAHPFHLHGTFFQVIDHNGKPVRPLAWRDTIDVPVDHTIRIAVRFDEHPGTWMFHCHILDHAKKGMMALVEVTDPAAATPSR